MADGTNRPRTGYGLPADDASERTIGTRIARAISRAKMAITWETVWPRLAPVLLIGAVFLIVSWFGIWRALPEAGRIALLVLFGIAALVSLIPLIRIRVPSRESALARVEIATGAPHRPATAFTDKLATDRDDPTTRALFARHRERLLASLGRLKAGTPSPGLARRDPYALRFAVLLLLAIGFVYASGNRVGLVGEAFEPAREPVAIVAARIDAWASPPSYTGRPPIFLTGDMARAANGALAVPTGTIVTVRIGTGAEDLMVTGTTATTGEVAIPAEIAAAARPTGLARREAAGNGAPPVEHRITLTEETAVAVRRGTETVHDWTFTVIPDAAPTIAIAGQPQTEQSGALRLAYTVGDDYGVLAGEARFARPVAEGEAVGRPLYDPPNFPLALPRVGARDGNAETVRDLTTHPWAGATVDMTLAVRDALEQEGVSETLQITLPARPFTKPLALAIVEQRRNLAMNAEDAPKVASAIDALTLFPEKFVPQAAIYLGLRSAYYQTIHSHSDDDLRAVADLLWTVALAVEEGALSDAAQALREAQENLRQALENNAPQEEIARLTEALREAMQQFMQALAEQQQQNPQQQQQQAGQTQDLDQMLQELQERAEAGDMAAAQQLLDQLQRMMQALQNGQMQAQQQRGPNPQMEALNELGELIQRQQELMDETYALNQQPEDPLANLTDEQLAQLMDEFRQQQQQQQQQQQGQQQQGQQPGQQQGQQPGQQPGEQQQGQNQQGQQPGQQQGQQPGQQPGQQGGGQQPGGQQQQLTQEQFQQFLEQLRQNRQAQRDGDLGDLRRQQQQLQEQLGELTQKLQGMGMQPGENFGTARNEMGQAATRLGDGRPGPATENQGEALEQLRDGAQQMAEQMAQQQGQGQGMQMGQQPNQPGQERQANRNEDPLGRPYRNEGPDFGDQVRVPDEIDVQRAREILETIRRRLGEMGRPQEELNYLERLLERY